MNNIYVFVFIYYICLKKKDTLFFLNKTMKPI
jgi:hypothetical protein